MTSLSSLLAGDRLAFTQRHIGVNAQDEQAMCAGISPSSMPDFIESIVPDCIKRSSPIELPAPVNEAQALKELESIANQNQLFRNYIGQGYYGTITPPVIVRNVLENPSWYTAYTPYQAEISQGRMEALINFQTMISDLTGMDIANASMLDEATSAAEAMTLAKRSTKNASSTLLVEADCHPQTLRVLQTRAQSIGLEIKIIETSQWKEALSSERYFAAFQQYPSSTGLIQDLTEYAHLIHQHEALFIVAADLLALTLLKSPGEMQADIVIGSSQRFGMPMGAGGPHAAYLACKDAYKRSMPGRLVGVSKDVHGQAAYRLSLQTREQHIRREKATSNICTAQALPAIVASMYAIYHGPEGLKQMAQRIAGLTALLAHHLKQLGWSCLHATAFDTLVVDMQSSQHAQQIQQRALEKKINLRYFSAPYSHHIGLSLDETVTLDDLQTLCEIFCLSKPSSFEFSLVDCSALIPAHLQRSSSFLTHPVFHRHRSETQMLRYLRQLSDKDLALDRTMIPLGSCTMKLNATSEMMPITWPQWSLIHPFAPQEQLKGYQLLDQQLRQWLSAITGYADVSLQPNAGSQGEYAGLLIIQAFHRSKGQGHRDVCLIPASAHGTNPASAQMVGMKIVTVACDAKGNIDIDDLRIQCERYHEHLAAIMITYPSTHGVFESSIQTICEMIHAHGARVYIDGANMNALVGLAAPGQFGGDVSHLNLHKTFCIPHGGGGPGVGPVAVSDDLVPFLPASFNPSTQAIGQISASPLGNANVWPIAWMYIRMMGAKGLQKATEVAIMNANYIAAQLKPHYPILYTDEKGYVAHECIVDLRHFKDTCGVTAEDVAKRLMDYGFHAPTLSFPVANTLMIEPTESEDKREIDRFIDAMKAIRQEIAAIEKGLWPCEDNPIKNAPHTWQKISASQWPHPYSREIGAASAFFESHQNKYWPPVGRIDNVHGDRHLFCSCITN